MKINKPFLKGDRQDSVPFEERLLDQISYVLGTAFFIRLLILGFLGMSLAHVLTGLLPTTLILVVPLVNRYKSKTIAQFLFACAGLGLLVEGYLREGGISSLMPVLLLLYIGAIILLIKKYMFIYLSTYIVAFILLIYLETSNAVAIYVPYKLGVYYYITGYSVMIAVVMISVFAVTRYMDHERAHATETNRFLQFLMTDKRSDAVKFSYNSTALNSAAIKVDQTRKVTEKLFNTLSHNLRGPVTRIYSVMNLLQDHTLRDEERRQIQRGLQNDLDTTIDLLDNLVLWSEAQKKNLRVSPEPIVLYAEVQKAVFAFNTMLEESNITVHNQVDSNMHALADVSMLHSILKQLLSNAIRFSFDNSSIEVSADYVGDIIRVSIQDHGIGMTKEQFEKVFDASKTVGIGPKQSRGSGIGLIIAKEFVHQMGGQIDVVNEYKLGCVFSFTIPALSITMDSQQMIS